jgi:hypothetical protein
MKKRTQLALIYPENFVGFGFVKSKIIGWKSLSKALSEKRPFDN